MHLQKRVPALQLSRRVGSQGGFLKGLFTLRSLLRRECSLESQVQILFLNNNETLPPSKSVLNASTPINIQEIFSTTLPNRKTQVYYHPHFADERIEAQRSPTTCPSSCRSQWHRPGSHPGYLAPEPVLSPLHYATWPLYTGHCLSVCLSGSLQE